MTLPLCPPTLDVPIFLTQVESYPFLSRLKLRSAINLSAEPLNDEALEFFESAGVTMVRKRFPGGTRGTVCEVTRSRGALRRMRPLRQQLSETFVYFTRI